MELTTGQLTQVLVEATKLASDAKAALKGDVPALAAVVGVLKDEESLLEENEALRAENRAHEAAAIVPRVRSRDDLLNLIEQGVSELLWTEETEEVVVVEDLKKEVLQFVRDRVEPGDLVKAIVLGDTGMVLHLRPPLSVAELDDLMSWARFEVPSGLREESGFRRHLAGEPVPVDDLLEDMVPLGQNARHGGDRWHHTRTGSLWLSASCRSCGEPVVWVKTKTGKRMPVDSTPDTAQVVADVAAGREVTFDAETMVSHFATCHRLLRRYGLSDDEIHAQVADEIRKG